jgi:hypothetical protein
MKKIKHRFRKNLGQIGETIYRLMGKFGKARSYGHNAPGISNLRTRRELLQRAAEMDEELEAEDYD